MTALQKITLRELGQKVFEKLAVAALLVVVGYLTGNSDRAAMQAENDAQSRDISRLNDDLKALRANQDNLAPRVLTLEVQGETARAGQMKGDRK